ncbi:MAG: LamG-like jellyroll fold domain-containing protein [Phycisphaerales bacterium]
MRHAIQTLLLASLALCPFARAQCGSALEFDTNRYLAVPSSASIHSTWNSFTIEAWVYPTSTPPVFNAIAGEWNDLTASSRGCFIALLNTVPIVYLSHNGGDYISVNSGVIAPLNTWTHVAGTYDGANLRIYVNGVQRGTIPQTGSVFQASIPFHIGRLDAGGSTTQFFHGTIDEVRLWNVGRTGAQIVSDMNNAINAPGSGLVGCWNMNEGSDTTAFDISGFGNHALASIPSPVWTASTAPISGCCPADLNHDGIVEDTDFSMFVKAYNILDCADPAMPANCPADLNHDGVVEDSDFTLFVTAYNQLLCS